MPTPEPEQHALLGASSAKRWLKCPPSARLTESMHEEKSEYAEEGTLAHKLAELKLRDYIIKLKPAEKKKALAVLKKDKLWQDEMEWCTDMYLEHIQECALSFSTAPYIIAEQQVDFSDFVPEGFGTADCIMLTPATLDVVDYKHGKGVAVDVTDNAQLKLYAWGAYKRYQLLYPNIEIVTLHIVQPRNGGCGTYQLHMTELRQWMQEYVKPRAELADKVQGEFCNGEWCRFCKVSATCRARGEANTACMKQSTYGQLPPTLSDAEMGAILSDLEDVVAYHKKVKSYVEKQLLSGQPIEGWKLVAGRGKREWDNQLLAFAEIQKAGIAEALLYEREPLTPPALETLLGKKQFAEVASEHVSKKEGSPTVAKESDPRPAWSSAGADFAGLIEKEEE